jgi:hypothetical protein
LLFQTFKTKTMKNKLFTRLAALMAMLFAFGFSHATVKPPCGPYVIKNNVPCDIIVSYVYFCSGSGVCSSGTNVVIPIGGQLNVPACACPSGNCRMTVTLVQIGGTILSPAVTVGPVNTVASVPDCVGTPGAATIQWGPTVTTIF